MNNSDEYVNDVQCFDLNKWVDTLVDVEEETCND